MKLIGFSDVFCKWLTAWILFGIIMILGNGLFVGRDFATEGRSSGLRFILVAGPLLIVVQMIMSALLIKIYNFKSRIWSAITGAITGVLMPVVLFVLIWAVFTVTEPSWGEYFATGVVWTMIACSPSLLGAGLMSGTVLGYVGWKNRTSTLT